MSKINQVAVYLGKLGEQAKNYWHKYEIGEKIAGYCIPIAKTTVLLSGVAALAFGANEARTAFQAKNDIDALVRNEFDKRYDFGTIITDSAASRRIEVREAFTTGNQLYLERGLNDLSVWDYAVITKLLGKEVVYLRYAGDDEIIKAKREGSVLREKYTQEKTTKLRWPGRVILRWLL